MLLSFIPERVIKNQDFMMLSILAFCFIRFCDAFSVNSSNGYLPWADTSHNRTLGHGPSHTQTLHFQPPGISETPLLSGLLLTVPVDTLHLHRLHTDCFPLDCKQSLCFPSARANTRMLAKPRFVSFICTIMFPLAEIFEEQRPIAQALQLERGIEQPAIRRFFFFLKGKREKKRTPSYRLLVLGHRNLIKNMKQTAVINIMKNRILLTWRFVCYATYIFKSMTVTKFNDYYILLWKGSGT